MSPVKSGKGTGHKGGVGVPDGSKRDHIARLYHEGFIGSQIAQFTGYSRSYVYQVIKDLREEEVSGVVPDSGGQACPSSPVPPSGDKNVHAQRVRVQVHHAKPSYWKQSNKHLDLVVRGRKVSVQCQGRFVYLRAAARFWGADEEKAMWNSLSWWRLVVARVESRLGLTCFKRGAVAFEFTYHEWETAGSVVERDASARGERWQVWHSEDGKLRLSVDRSRGSCHETHHARDGHVDSVTFNRFLNGILDHPDAPGVPEIARLMLTTQKQLSETQAQLHEVASGMRAIVDIIRGSVGGRGSQESQEGEDGFSGGVWPPVGWG